MASKTLRVSCPECAADLVIDVETGTVVHHQAHPQPGGGGKSFEALMEGLEEDRTRAEEIFEREKAAMKDRDRLLEERFREAMKHAEELDDGTPPPSPFDHD